MSLASYALRVAQSKGDEAFFVNRYDYHVTPSMFFISPVPTLHYDSRNECSTKRDSILVFHFPL